MDRQSSTATSRNDDGSWSAHPPQDKGKMMRNRRPCGRCSKSQRKCDVEPPHSAALCRQCAKAGLAACPPYEPRKKASTADRSSRSSPTGSMSSHDGSVYAGKDVQQLQQQSGVNTDAVFLMHPTQVTQGPVAPLIAYTPVCPVPLLSAGYDQPSSSVYNWGSQADWKESVPTAPNSVPISNVLINAQRQSIPFHGQWGQRPEGVYNDSATYQTAPAYHDMPYP